VIEQVYGDRWGEVFDRPSEDLIELRWFDTTAEMSAPEFQGWLESLPNVSSDAAGAECSSTAWRSG
jgi:hypothetical protein